jgi:hypothetical protein
MLAGSYTAAAARLGANPGLSLDFLHIDLFASLRLCVEGLLFLNGPDRL